MLQSRQVEAFRAVMLTGAMTAAAEMIHVTQPAVSRLIRDLEAELGLVLFERRGNLVIPTAQAHALQAQVEKSFVGLQQIRDYADDLRTGRSGTLAIAALPAMAAGFLPRFVAAFCRDRPGLRVTIDGRPSAMVRDDVVSGRFELGLSLVPFQRKALTATIFADEAVVIMPATHRLSANMSVVPQDLAGEDIVLLSKFRQGAHPVERELQSVRLGRVIETSLSTIACVMVSEGAGLAIVDPFSASEFLGRGLVLRQLQPSMVVGTALVHSSERPLSVAAAEFHASFSDHVRTFLDQAAYLRG
jgi:DNA-binding transcriptional LysR family regulator